MDVALTVTKEDSKMTMIKYCSKALMVCMTMLMTVSPMNAQKNFTLEDLNFGGTNYRNMVPENRWTAWWGDQLVRLDVDACYLVDKANGKETRLFDVSQINQWIAPTKDIKVRTLYDAEFPFANKSVVVISQGSKTYMVDFKKHALVSSFELKDGENLLETNAQQTAYAFLKDNNLFVCNHKQQTVQLSTDGSREVVYGQAVHRDEFGISKGTFWSPDGNKLAFYRMDQSMVTDYPQVDIPEIGFDPEEKHSCIATPAPDKYPMAGETSHQVTVGVYDLNTGKTVYLKAGDPTDRYFTNVAWSPDSKTVYMFELNRKQNDCRLVAYSAETGNKTADLYRETDEKYVEPLHPIVFLPWDANSFIMQSRQDGYNHLYLCSLGKHGSRMAGNTESLEVSQLTAGKWEVLEMIGFNAKQKTIIIASNEKSPIQQNIYAVSVKTGKRTLLGNGDGWHNAKLSGSGNYILDNYSTPTVPRRIEIVQTTKAKAVSYFQAKDPWMGSR